MAALQGRRWALAGRAGESQDKASRAPRSARTRAVRASAARRPGAERRQHAAHVRRADGPLAGALRVAATLADDQAFRREAPAPCPRQAAAWWRRGRAARAAQLEDRRAVAVDAEPPARVLPSALRGGVDAIGGLVDEPEPGQPARAAKVQGSQAQACHRRRRRGAAGAVGARS